MTLGQNCEATVQTKKLQALLEASKGQTRRAIQAMVWRIAAHPKQDLNGVDYTELSIGYIAKAADVGWETARRAWHQVRKVLGWGTLSASQALARGARLRQRDPGTNWGQHLLVSRPSTSAAIRACQAAELAEPHVGLPDGPAWVTVHPVSRGRHLTTSCPWHEDQNPSMILYPNPGGASGSAICLACIRDGRRLTAYWRRVGTDYRMRLSRSPGSSPSTRRVGTIDNRGAEDVQRGSVLLATRGSRGARFSVSRAPGLVEALRAADRSSRNRHAEAETAAIRLLASPIRLDPRALLPALYISLDEMAPATWMPNPRKPGGFLPETWGPSATTHVAVDLDRFDDAPLGEAEIELEARRLAHWAEKRRELSGEVAVIRTSHFGLQVIFGLRQHRSPGWRASPMAERLHGIVEAKALGMAKASGFTGGTIDQTARGAGRMVRRPGPRLDKDDLPYVSHLVFSVLKAELGSEVISSVLN